MKVSVEILAVNEVWETCHFGDEKTSRQLTELEGYQDLWKEWLVILRERIIDKAFRNLERLSFVQKFEYNFIRGTYLNKHSDQRKNIVTP